MHTYTSRTHWQIAEVLSPYEVEYVVRWSNFERRVASSTNDFAKVKEVYEVSARKPLGMFTHG
jgi:hypothetical protein